MNNPLASPKNYEQFIYNLPNHYTYIKQSSLIYVPLGTEIGKCMGMIIFSNDIILCILEYLNFELNVIEGYGYEVSRYDMSKPLPSTKEYCRASYENKQKEYWYDSFPHPHDPNLAITHRY